MHVALGDTALVAWAVLGWLGSDLRGFFHPEWFCLGAAESPGAVWVFPSPLGGFGGALGAVGLPGAPWLLPFLAASPLSKQEFPAGGRGRDPPGPGGI